MVRGDFQFAVEARRFASPKDEAFDAESQRDQNVTEMWR